MTESLTLPPPIRSVIPEDPEHRWWWWETDNLAAETEGFYNWYFLPLHDAEHRFHVLEYPHTGILKDDPALVARVRADLCHWKETGGWWA